ncbi:hypothetical protein [Sphingosinicella rhizophila]|uniref:hypothetical protein n=1 Tax=Sphingosinicella rhizophila TaxID=3050082 RepID=UPI0028E4D56B|nr:hypothetical protein [Sphingosinicella sp. GR2756]
MESLAITGNPGPGETIEARTLEIVDLHGEFSTVVRGQFTHADGVDELEVAPFDRMADRVRPGTIAAAVATFALEGPQDGDELITGEPSAHAAATFAKLSSGDRVAIPSP